MQQKVAYLICADIITMGKVTLILLNRKRNSDQSTKTLPYPIPSNTHTYTQNPLFKCANGILTNMEKGHRPRGPQALFQSAVFLRECPACAQALPAPYGISTSGLGPCTASACPPSPQLGPGTCLVLANRAQGEA